MGADKTDEPERPAREGKAMSSWAGGTLAAARAVGALVSQTARGAQRAPDRPPADTRGKSIDVEKTSRRFLTFVLLPTWLLLGFGDYVCHRASKIERTSGTHESLTHLLMLGSAGTGLTAALFCEVNETVLAVMTAAAIAHEAVVLWDIGYASPLRPPSPTEQHVHSFLEVLPFTGLAFMMCLNPDDLAVMLGRGSRPFRFRLEPKQHPLGPVYATTVIVLASVLLVIPHLEEFVRCYRVDHTILPHDRPIDAPESG